MTNNTRGFAMPTVIALVAVVLVLGGIAYYASRPEVENAKMAEEKAMMPARSDAEQSGGEKKAMAEKEAMAQKEKEVMMEKPSDAKAMEGKEDGAMMPARSDAEQSGGAKYTGTVLAGKSAPLIDYNKADYDAAVKSDKLVALYFVANWCPICKVELPKLYAAYNELTTDKVIGFQVNYNDSDTDANEKALASQFGVAYQHTKVFVKNGQRILKSPESWSKEQHLSEINKALTQ